QIESDEENWDDVEIPSSGLIISDNISDAHDDDDVGKILSTATDDMSGITIVDSDDDTDNILSSTVAFQNSLSTSKNKNPHLLDVSNFVNNLDVVEAIIGDLKNSFSNNEFSGTITKLGGDNSKKVIDMDDWDNDMEIPEAGLSFCIPPSKSSRNNYVSWDDEFLDLNNILHSTSSLPSDIPSAIPSNIPSDILPSTVTTLKKNIVIKRVDDPTTISQKVVESGNTLFSGVLDSRLSILVSPAPSSSNFESEDESFDDLQIPDSIERLTLFPPRHVQDGNAFEPVHKNIVPHSSLSSEKSSASTNNSSISRSSRSSPSFLSKKVSKKNCNSSFVTPPPSPNKIVSHSKKDTNVMSKRPSTVSPKTSSPPLKKCKSNVTLSKSINSSTSKEKVSSKSSTKSVTKSSTTSKSRTMSTSKTSNSNVTGSVKENFNPSLKSKKSVTSGKSSSTTKSVDSTRLSKVASSPSLKSKPSGFSSLTKHSNISSISLSSVKTNRSLPSMSFEKKSHCQTTVSSSKSSKSSKSLNINSKPSHSRVKSAPMSLSVKSTVNKTNSKNQKNCGSKTLRIMLKPNNSQNFGDGTELDAFDDLPVCMDKERAYKKYPTSPAFEKIVLLRLDQRLQQEATQNLELIQIVVKRWDGNESILKDFDPSPQRPALISNMNPQSTNTKSLQVVGKMIFDPEKMCWFHSSAKDNNNSMSSEEEELLALFDDEEEIVLENSKDTDDPDESNKFKYHTTCGETFGMNNGENDELLDRLASASLVFSDGDHNEIVYSAEGRRRRRIIPTGGNGNGNKQTNDNNGDGFDDNNEFQVGSEFDVSKGFLAALVASERQHKKEMNRWYPAIRSIRNEQRFGLKDSNNSQRGFLYEIRNPAI
ncbi:12616_t:CDS:2, partial [Racocetra persica]